MSRRDLTRATLALLAGISIGLAAPGNGADASQVLDAIRAQAASLPVLPASREAGSPKFTVVRLNAPPIVVDGVCYGAARITCPPDVALDLIWLFSDITTIDAYDLVPLKSEAPKDESIRFIYKPTASLEQEENTPRGHPASSFPRPWDLFQLHLLAVPARQLKPGGEYLIWFRFADRRPSDLLLAVTFLPPDPKRTEPELPGVFGLPLEIGR